MAKDISLLNAVYQDVPAVELPLDGGGTATFTDTSDTTAVASDVAQGKYFFNSLGILTAGTATGGVGVGGITQDENGYLVLDDDAPAPSQPQAGVCVCGTFTTGSTGGVAETVTIPYTGSGYPKMVTVSVSEGAYNSNGTAYNTLKRYAVVSFFAVKNDNSTPTYGQATVTEQVTVKANYKSSATTANTLTTANSQSQGFYNTAAWASSTAVVQASSATTLSVFVAASSYGLLPNTEYSYCIGYSA